MCRTTTGSNSTCAGLPWPTCSYSPFTATITLSQTLRRLLEDVVQPNADVGDVAFALRNYTVGFVIEEQAYLSLMATGEWDDLVTHLPRDTPSDSRAVSDAVAILQGDRDDRYRAGLRAILAGLTV